MCAKGKVKLWPGCCQFF
uniref:Uncharacterized protein n=1 Tax=Zea mays TaxID=4577 RepID=C4J187_MAIZE|nr:unknown [Zea mays]